MIVGPHRIDDTRLIPVSLVRALDVVGDPWAMQIIKEAFLGVRRFQEFQARLNITRQTLIIRLNRFVDEALMYKSPAQHGRLVYEYRLTAKGSDLYDFILMIWRWHKRWQLEGSGLPHELVHRSCGKALEPVMACATCNGPISLESLELRQAGNLEQLAKRSQRRPRILNRLEGRGANLLATVVIGDGWSIQILTAIMRGLCNYDGIRRALGISSNVLSARLKTLVSLELLWCEEDTTDGRMVTYRLTKKGEDIFPMVVALTQWGDRWLAGRVGPPDILLHKSCGAILEHGVHCAHCNERVRAEDVSIGSQ